MAVIITFEHYVYGLVWFYGISTIVGYLMPNPVFTYTFNIWFVNILLITFLNKAELNFFGSQLNGFKYCYVTVII